MLLNIKISKLFSFITPVFLILFFIPILMVCCSSSAEYIAEKMDTPLQQRINQLEKDNPDEIIRFAGKTNRPIIEEMTAKLKSTGITIESIVEDIFTASGNSESIKKVSLLDFVVFLEIARRLDIK